MAVKTPTTRPERAGILDTLTERRAGRKSGRINTITTKSEKAVLTSKCDLGVKRMTPEDNEEASPNSIKYSKQNTNEEMFAVESSKNPNDLMNLGPMVLVA